MKRAIAASICLFLALPAAASAADPKPRTGKSVVVKRAKGAVFVQKRGSSKRSRLGKAARSVPVGSVIDASRGTVKLTSTANKRGTKRQSATFYDGAFRVTQDRSARLTDLELVGGDFSGCAATTAKPGTDAVFASRRRARRRLWGRGRGRFRTRGRNGSATVRGTTWKTEDSCAGTETFNREGKVMANAEGADLEKLLEPGQSVIYYCDRDGVPGVAELYCVLVLSQPARRGQPYDLVAFGIATAGSPFDSYGLCATRNGSPPDCGPFPFHPPDGDGHRVAGVGCLFNQSGAYTARWYVGGVELPVPLPFSIRRPFEQTGCVSDPPRPGIDDQAKAGAPLRQARAAAR